MSAVQEAPVAPTSQPLSPCPPVPPVPCPRLTRRLLELSCLTITALLLFRALGVEPYGVPTGSMAPALLGNHKTVMCPRCGYPVQVGSNGSHARGHHESAVCSNCGCTDLDVENAPAVAGDHLLVNKNVYDWRRPRRWEMVVFRCPADRDRAFVKRVVGLPGENVQVRDGDVYIDNQLARKSFAEFKAVRIPLFDSNFAPRPEGWEGRWELQGGGNPAPRSPGAALQDTALCLQATHETTDYQWLTYRNTQPEHPSKVQPLDDEYSYNGGAALPREPVHDFQMECDLEVEGGSGWLALGMTDGSDHLVVELPVGDLKSGTRLGEGVSGVAGHEAERTYRRAPGFGLRVGKTYHVELAFVDRRATLLVNGSPPFAPLDRPAPEGRAEVTRPVRIGARGVDVRLHNFRLFRDVHYTEAGRHGVRTPVHLGAREYFVLGDNSPNSDDNRFWSDAEGRPLPVREGLLLGKPFLVHLPSRVTRWEGFGCTWEYQGLDWGQVRWLQ